MIDCNEVIKLLSDKLIVSSDNLYSDWKAFIKTVRSELSSPDKANKTNEPFIESVKFIFDLMKITGHRTERSFLKYIRVSKLDTAKRLRVIRALLQMILKKLMFYMDDEMQKSSCGIQILFNK